MDRRLLETVSDERKHNNDNKMTKTTTTRGIHRLNKILTKCKKLSKFVTEIGLSKIEKNTKGDLMLSIHFNSLCLG